MIVDHSKTIRDLLTERRQALQGFEKVLDLPMFCVDQTSRYRTVVWEVTDAKRVGCGVEVTWKGTHSRGYQSVYPETDTAFYPDRDPETKNSRRFVTVEVKKPMRVQKDA